MMLRLSALCALAGWRPRKSVLFYNKRVAEETIILSFVHREETRMITSLLRKKFMFLF